MEGESRILASEILPATYLVEQVLAPTPGDSLRHAAFKAAVLADWTARRIPLAQAVKNDIFIGECFHFPLVSVHVLCKSFRFVLCLYLV
jgi:hypothetical protein